MKKKENKVTIYKSVSYITKDWEAIYYPNDNGLFIKNTPTKKSLYFDERETAFLREVLKEIPE